MQLTNFEFWQWLTFWCVIGVTRVTPIIFLLHFYRFLHQRNSYLTHDAEHTFRAPGHAWFKTPYPSPSILLLYIYCISIMRWRLRKTAWKEKSPSKDRGFDALFVYLQMARRTFLNECLHGDLRWVTCQLGEFYSLLWDLSIYETLLRIQSKNSTHDSILDSVEFFETDSS